MSLANVSRPWTRALAGVALFVALATGSTLVAAGATSGEAAGEESYVVTRHVLTAMPDGSVSDDEESWTVTKSAFFINPNIWPASAIPVKVWYNGVGEPIESLDLPAIIQEQISTWNAAGSAFAFQWAGPTTAATGACDEDTIRLDGFNTIKFADLPGLTLGITCSIHASGANKPIVEFDMQLDQQAGLWSSSLPVPFNRYDLPTTVLHELGHAAGLGHSCGSTTAGSPACTSALTKSVMFRSIDSGESRRKLTEDDLTAIRQAYPSNVPPTPSPSPSPAPSPTAPDVPLNFRVRAPLLSRD